MKPLGTSELLKQACKRHIPDYLCDGTHCITIFKRTREKIITNYYKMSFFLISLCFLPCSMPSLYLIKRLMAIDNRIDICNHFIHINDNQNCEEDGV